MRALIPTTKTLVSGPAMEPLDLAEVKKQLRWSTTSEDTLLDMWVAAARQYFEDQTGRQVMEATWELKLNGFPVGPIELPHPPLLEVVSIVYVGSDGSDVTLDADSYRVEAPSGPRAEPGFVYIPSGGTWPVAQDQPGAVRVRFKAGYGAAPGDVPELIRSILYLIVGNFHKYRSETVETRFESAISTLPLGATVFMPGFEYTARPKYPPRYADNRVVA